MTSDEASVIEQGDRSERRKDDFVLVWDENTRYLRFIFRSNQFFKSFRTMNCVLVSEANALDIAKIVVINDVPPKTKSSELSLIFKQFPEVFPEDVRVELESGVTL